MWTKSKGDVPCITPRRSPQMIPAMLSAHLHRMSLSTFVPRYVGLYTVIDIHLQTSNYTLDLPKNIQNQDWIFNEGEECKYTIHLPHSPVLLPIPTPGPTPDPNSGTTFPIPTPGPTSDPNSGTTSRSYLPIPTPGLLPRFPISIFPFRNHTFLFRYLSIASHCHSLRPTSLCVIAIISSLY